MNWTTPATPSSPRLLSNPSEGAVAVTNVPPPPPQPVQQVVLQFSGRLSASLIFTSHPGDHPLALTLDFASYRPTRLHHPRGSLPTIPANIIASLCGFCPPTVPSLFIRDGIVYMRFANFSSLLFLKIYSFEDSTRWNVDWKEFSSLEGYSVKFRKYHFSTRWERASNG